MTLNEDSYKLKFEFAGPVRTSDERHHFHTISKHYADQAERSRRASLSDILSKD